MRISNPTLLAVLVAVAWLQPLPALAASDYDNCTGFIDSVPATITTQGTWCLRQDLSTSIASGAAISVMTNNVTIDCNDFKIGGLSAGLGTATDGIRSINRLNTTVRHCNVRGFYHGVALEGAEGRGHLVEDNRADGNTHIGLSIDGDGAVIRRNLVLDTGGSTIDPVIRGISVHDSADVIDNTVSGVLPGPDSTSVVGIFSFRNFDGSISGNRVRGLVPPAGGQVIAINNPSSERISLVGNHLVGDVSAGSIGVFCQSVLGRAKDNVVNGFASSLSGCSNDGNTLVP